MLMLYGGGKFIRAHFTLYFSPGPGKVVVNDAERGLAEESEFIDFGEGDD